MITATSTQVNANAHDHHQMSSSFRDTRTASIAIPIDATPQIRTYV